MCGEAYTPDEVTHEPKNMGSRRQGKILPLEGGVGGGRLQMGIHIQRIER